MAIADRLSIKPFNGVSMGAIIKVTAADVTAGYVEISFDGPSDEGLPYPCAFSILVRDASNVHKPLVDAVIIENLDGATARNGFLRIQDGAATFDLVAGDVIQVIAQPARTEL